MPDVTYNDHGLAATPDGSEVVPMWQSSGAKKMPFDAFRELRHNPSGVSAAGTNQAGATTLSASFDEHNVTTVASGAGTKFAALALFRNTSFKIVRCSGSAANNLLHYPASGGKFNDQSINTPISIEKGNAALFYSVSTLDWNTIP